jgi:penicillin-binding protein 1A
MGITSHLEPGLALTLGVSEVTPLEITSAFGVFANNGIRVKPTAIIKIENRDGVTLYKHRVEETQALDPNIAAVMDDLMQGVILRGTGVRARLSRPAAAKTGTTEKFHDAWFIGFVPQLVTGVWVGNDDNTSMNGVAEVAICPRIWKEYNEVALVDVPVVGFPKPTGLSNVKICMESNKLTTPYCPASKVRWVTLWDKDLPSASCDLHRQPEELENEASAEGENGENYEPSSD